jgi:N-methylhydantoinase B
MEVVFLSDGTLNPARGVHGGLNGAPARQYLRLPDGSLSEPLGSYVRLTLEAGQTIVSYSCGGGGYGEPAARDPLKVAEDVREGWITSARAREIYKVAVTEGGVLDDAGTQTLRADDTEADSREESSEKSLLHATHTNST